MMPDSKAAPHHAEETKELASLSSTQSESNMSDDVESQVPVVQHLRLEPVPSDDPDDPLNWPLWLKIAIITQTSLLAAIGGLNTATINPAMLQLSREFGVDRVRASYQTTVCIALNGIAPWLWIPLAYKYGRRPVYLATTLLGFVSILGCAYTQTYTQLLIARIFNGLFPVGFALGATTVTDLFFFHQRGRAMGFFTVTVVNGAHMAPIIGGLLGQYSGWRWIFKFLAIVDAVLFVVALFCLPETMYHRRSARSVPRTFTTKFGPVDHTTVESGNSSSSALAEIQLTTSHISTTTLDIGRPTLLQPRTRTQTYLYYLRLYSTNPDYQISYVSTIMPTLRLFLSPTAVFPAVYYASMYGFASILPAVTVAAIFTEFFHWDTLHIGLSFGAALTIGGILGEFFAGWICDAVVKKEQARLKNDPRCSNETKVKPEVRLRPIWPGAILTPIGLLIYGFTLQYHTHPALPLFGMGLSCFGLQIITTCTYTYAIDCHTSTADNKSSTNKAGAKGSNRLMVPQTDPIKPKQPQIINSNQSLISFSSGPASPITTAAAVAVVEDAGITSSLPPQSSPSSSSPPTIREDTSSNQDRSAGAAQVAQLFNFIRQMFGFTFAFYVVHMGERIGFQWTFTIFAFCGGVLAFSPVVWLIFFRRVGRLPVGGDTKSTRTL